ncbi:winged helix-turn-helix domain-containing protein [Actinoplanes derwentensis]|uniref:Helix-turn-helix domain-containing protein n=1 Tax=Actinoplanes derwentensis TaxID=113562 RepID=A0A1H1XPU6_9ACTN|nr:winged helix-turn-helix domain-containing protein [Actinoplanes derwentensis]GID90447.1 transcriptional regulator [Actinoplanes derwentensis]SDT11220.1 Helix-turn-helix domain-containing protein [Actinoplanes derwentensis]
MAEGPRTPGYDSTHDVVLDARTLRGVAHPLRLRLLGSLRHEGPQTATQLAARLGESSASTSYHLRTLAAHGFVTDAPELGRGRERFWRAVHRSTWFETPDQDAPERELGEAYLRTVARMYADNVEQSINELADWPQEWVQASNMSDTTIRLSASETRQLSDDLMALLARYRKQATERGDDESERVAMTTQFQIFPRRGQLDDLLARRTAPADTESSGAVVDEPSGAVAGDQA